MIHTTHNGSINNGKLKKLRISFCTVSKNRLIHLKETFLKNVEDNISYGNIEFNLLNYDSDDDIDIWAEQYLTKYIKQGIVNYFKIRNKIFFDRSHSRNLIFRLSNSDIICNIDADNFCGVGFASYLNEIFNKDSDGKIFIRRSPLLLKEEDRNSLGRIAVTREQFNTVRGFDEAMSGYGFEDTDFINRLTNHGYVATDIIDAQYLKGISHSKTMRVSEEKFTKSLKDLFVRHVTPYHSCVFCYFKSGKFEYKEIVDSELLQSIKTKIPRSYEKYRHCATEHQLLLVENSSIRGNWKVIDNKIVLSKKNLSLLESTIGSKSSCWQSVLENLFFKVDNSVLLQELSYLLPQLDNRIKMERNKLGLHCVNKLSFGKGKVIKNFVERIEIF